MNLATARAIAPVKLRSAFTLFEERTRIMGELANVPEGKRGRAMRRRLTCLDRQLTEEQAGALDRLARGHLAVLSRLGASPIREAVDKSQGHSLPFGEGDRDLIGGYRFVVAQTSTSPAYRSGLRAFLASVEPDTATVLDGHELAVIRLSRRSVELFSQWDQKS